MRGFYLKRQPGCAAGKPLQQNFSGIILRIKPLGFKFRRQHAFSHYILDFYCHALHLAIEVDGFIHEIEEVKQNDEQRQRQLEEQGLTFLRFNNNQIKLQPEEVIQQIEQHLQSKIKLL